MNRQDHPPAWPGEEPKIPRRVSPTIRQWIGIPLIAAVPILAILGVFGERATTTGARSATLDVRVSYPIRFRYRQVQLLQVTIWNRSAAPFDTVFVSYDTAYISRFSSVRFDPPTIAANRVPVVDVAPGAAGVSYVELWGEQYGRHRGRIVVGAHGDSVMIPISTIVFP